MERNSKYMGRESVQRYRRRLDEVKAPYIRWTTCLCPFENCGMLHRVKMNWTGGGGMPRRYCRRHMGVVSRTECSYIA